MNNSTAAGEKRTDSSNDTAILRSFCAQVGKDDLERAALILGRERAELESMLAGELEVDEDLVMKMRGIAQERGFEVES